MAHYAKISNAEFTVSERARLLEAKKERDILLKDNMSTEEIDEEIASLNETIKNALCRVTDVITGVDEYTSNGNEYFDGNDNTEYWESEYGNSKRTSYNTKAGVHKNGGTPFRKNYAGIGHIYDPVRDAFYSEQPYASWVLNEDTCTWEAPEPPPGEAVWNEKTLEWVDFPNKPFKSWIHDTKTIMEWWLY